MSTIVTSDLIKSSIASKLSTLYPSTDIFKEQVVEGLTYPSFFINQISVTPTHMTRNKYLYIFLMNINYYENPSDTQLYKKIENVGVDLIEQLEIITVGALNIKGKNITAEKSDGTLVMTVEYSIPVEKVLEEGIMMEQLDLNEKIK